MATVYFARKKGFERHGKIAAVPVVITLVSIVFVMALAFLEITSTVPGSPLTVITTLHHLTGLTAFAMAALLLVKPCTWVGAKFGNLKNYMLTLFFL